MVGGVLPTWHAERKENTISRYAWLKNENKERIERERRVENGNWEGAWRATKQQRNARTRLGGSRDDLGRRLRERRKKESGKSKEKKCAAGGEERGEIVGREVQPDNR